MATTGPRRAVQLQDVPTLEESGYPGMVFKPWVGIVAPPGTPPQSLAKLNAAFNTALKLPEVRKAMDDGAWIVTGSTSEEFLARIKADTEAYAPIVKQLALTLD